MTGLMGMNRHSGQTISGIAYLQQRAQDALTLFKGDTLMLRDRGFNASLIDQPADANFVIGVYAEIARLLATPMAGLPDYQLTRVAYVGEPSKGNPTFNLTGNWLPEGREVTLSGLVLSGTTNTTTGVAP